MRTRALLGLPLIVSLLLAGCSGNGGGASDEDLDQKLDELDLKATDSTGVIRGVVVDPTIKPIAGAVVNVRTASFNKTVSTNGEGLFGLDGLQPGDYFVSANATGYKAAQQVVNVVAGESDPKATRIQLDILAGLSPYHTVRQYDAFIGCSVTTPTVSAAVCDMDDTVKEITNNEFLVTYEADQVPTWIQVEAIWDPSQALSNDLSLSITDFQGATQRTVADADGGSPLYITVNETVARAHNYGINNSLVIRVFSTTVEGTDNVDESTFQDPYASSGYGTLNSTGAPGAYQDTVVDNDPSCIVAFCLLNNPFGNPECIEDPVLFDACFGLGGLGVVVNQKVTVYTHIFYGYAPPEGWRFSEDPVVPLPP